MQKHWVLFLKSAQQTFRICVVNITVKKKKNQALDVILPEEKDGENQKVRVLKNEKKH